LTINPPPLTTNNLYRWTIHVLRKYNIRPRKRLSQSFIVNPRIIHDFLRETRFDLRLMEIGSGLGTLTYYLSHNVEKYSIHVEIDERLISICEELLRGSSRSLLINGDALDLEWDVEEIVSNAPYHITSDLIVKTARSNSVVYAVYVFQKDFVDRLLAKPGDRDYGRITVLVNIIFDLVRGPIYPPKYFYPEPSVSSQMIIFKRKRLYDGKIRILEDVTRKMFSMRRRKAVRVIEELGLNTGIAHRIGIKDNMRVYELSPEVFMRLVEELM
jgi:16S rRNA (adenine1518-N6/adenine1519-N6)-dimethyltransferase